MTINITHLKCFKCLLRSQLKRKELLLRKVKEVKSKL